MPDEVPARRGRGGGTDAPRPNTTGPICRAAPTRLAVRPRGARSRRWLIIGAIVVAALLAGASVALAATSSGRAHPGHAPASLAASAAIAGRWHAAASHLPGGRRQRSGMPVG